MGFTNPGPLYEKSRKKDGDQVPSLYEGKKKENPDWDKIDDMGEGDNPFSKEKNLGENVRFFIILVIAVVVIIIIGTSLGLPAGWWHKFR